MHEKIDKEFCSPLTANFLPEHPVDGWPIFQGLFSTFYDAQDDLCEFKAPNLQECGVGKKNKIQKAQIITPTRRKDRLRLVEKRLKLDLSQELRLLIKGVYSKQLSPNQGIVRYKGEHLSSNVKSSHTQPLICSKCRKQYKKIRSSRTHIFQAHMNIVPEGSSHTLPGRPNVRTMHLCPNPSTKFDQLQQPRQDQVLSS